MSKKYPYGCPKNLDGWNKLRKKTSSELEDIGFGVWNVNHKGYFMLIDGMWYDFIPDGLVLECIDGNIYTSGKDKIDDDTRGGYLAYGFRVEKK